MRGGSALVLLLLCHVAAAGLWEQEQELTPCQKKLNALDRLKTPTVFKSIGQWLGLCFDEALHSTRNPQDITWLEIWCSENAWDGEESSPAKDESCVILSWLYDLITANQRQQKNYWLAKCSVLLECKQEVQARRLAKAKWVVVLSIATQLTFLLWVWLKRAIDLRMLRRERDLVIQVVDNGKRASRPRQRKQLSPNADPVYRGNSPDGRRRSHDASRKTSYQSFPGESSSTDIPRNSRHRRYQYGRDLSRPNAQKGRADPWASSETDLSRRWSQGKYVNDPGSSTMDLSRHRPITKSAGETEGSSLDLARKRAGIKHRDGSDIKLSRRKSRSEPASLATKKSGKMHDVRQSSAMELSRQKSGAKPAESSTSELSRKKSRNADWQGSTHGDLSGRKSQHRDRKDRSATDLGRRTDDQTESSAADVSRRKSRADSRGRSVADVSRRKSRLDRKSSSTSDLARRKSHGKQRDSSPVDKLIHLSSHRVPRGSSHNVSRKGSSYSKDPKDQQGEGRKSSHRGSSHRNSEKKMSPVTSNEGDSQNTDTMASDSFDHLPKKEALAEIKEHLQSTTSVANKHRPSSSAGNIAKQDSDSSNGPVRETPFQSDGQASDTSTVSNYKHSEGGLLGGSESQSSEVSGRKHQRSKKSVKSTPFHAVKSSPFTTPSQSKHDNETPYFTPTSSAHYAKTPYHTPLPSAESSRQEVTQQQKDNERPRKRSPSQQGEIEQNVKRRSPSQHGSSDHSLMKHSPDKAQSSQHMAEKQPHPSKHNAARKSTHNTENEPQINPKSSATNAAGHPGTPSTTQQKRTPSVTFDMGKTPNATSEKPRHTSRGLESEQIPSMTTNKGKAEENSRSAKTESQHSPPRSSASSHRKRGPSSSKSKLENEIPVSPAGSGLFAPKDDNRSLRSSQVPTLKLNSEMLVSSSGSQMQAGQKSPMQAGRKSPSQMQAGHKSPSQMETGHKSPSQMQAGHKSPSQMHAALSKSPSQLPRKSPSQMPQTSPSQMAGQNVSPRGLRPSPSGQVQKSPSRMQPTAASPSRMLGAAKPSQVPVAQSASRMQPGKDQSQSHRQSVPHLSTSRIHKSPSASPSRIQKTPSASASRTPNGPRASPSSLPTSGNRPPPSATSRSPDLTNDSQQAAGTSNAKLARQSTLSPNPQVPAHTHSDSNMDDNTVATPTSLSHTPSAPDPRVDPSRQPSSVHSHSRSPSTHRK